MALPKPVDVHAEKTEKRVRITWDDGHESEMTMAYLRGHCPCAGCQGHGGAHQFYEIEGPGAELADMTNIGGYAIGLKFGDGHQTGIYSYEHLIKICPCDDHGGPGLRPENLEAYK